MIVSYSYWVLITLDLAVTNEYQSMVHDPKEDIIVELGYLIVSASTDYFIGLLDIFIFGFE